MVSQKRDLSKSPSGASDMGNTFPSLCLRYVVRSFLLCQFVDQQSTLFPFFHRASLPSPYYSPSSYSHSHSFLPTRHVETPGHGRPRMTPGFETIIGELFIVEITQHGFLACHLHGEVMMRARPEFILLLVTVSTNFTAYKCCRDINLNSWG